MEPTFLEVLQKNGFIPDPIVVLSALGRVLEQYGLWKFSITLGVIVYVAIALAQLLGASLTVRAKLAYAMALRGLFVGAFLAAFFPIRDASFYLWNKAYEAGTKIGENLMDTSLSDNALLNLVGVATGGVALGAASMVTKVTSEGAKRILEKGIAHEVDVALQKGIATNAKEAMNTTVKGGLQGLKKTLDYLNLFGLMLLPVMLSMVAVVILSGALLLLANLAFPPLVAVLMASPATGFSFFNLWFRAFLGSVSTSLLVPVVYGLAAFLALKAPAEALWPKVEEALDGIFNIVNVIAVVPFFINVGKLIWALLTFVVALGISVWIGWLLVQNAGRYVAQLTSGAIAGGSVGELMATFFGARTVSRAARPFLARTSGAAADLAEGVARAGYETTKGAAQDLATRARLTFRNWRREREGAKLPEGASPYPTPRDIFRPTNQHSIRDYLRARAQLRKEGFSKENAAFFAEKELREGRRINLEGETKARYLSRAGFHLKAEEEDSE